MAARVAQARRRTVKNMRGRRHQRIFEVLSLLLCLCVGTATSAAARTLAFGSSPSSSALDPDARVLLDRYCVTCHNGRLQTAGLRLDDLEVGDVRPSATTWEKIVRKLRAGSMPPRGRPRPDVGTTTAFLGKLEAALDAAAATHPVPGRPPTFHRLNRTEYQTVVRDLLALDVDVSTMLPPDDASYGFDNIAGVLRLSPTLLERYMAAARRVSQLAVGNIAVRPTFDTFRVAADLAQDDRLADLPVGTRGGLALRYHFPLDALYDITIDLALNANNTIAGFTEPHQIEVTIDGERAALLTVGPKRRATASARATAPPDGQPVLEADGGVRVRVPVKAGPHAVAVAFLKRPSAEPEDLRRGFLRPAVTQNDTKGQPYLDKVTISGPYEATSPGDTPSRRRIFSCRPRAPQAERACAEEILRTLARRAYRRPVTESDRRVLIQFYDEGRAAGTFDAGIENSIRRLLVSPSFLFRIERDPVGLAAGSPYRLADLELASRLSFFLWSSIPDDHLLDLAERGRLKEPAVLAQEVRRMLADPRSQALVANFAGQWLYLRNLPSTSPDPRLFPDFDDGLRQAFRRETELLFESVLRDDRSVVELLDTNYTFVNERLARHYGIPHVYGSHFRRIELPAGSPRGGLLGHGSILTVTSYATRTSPVVRGAWILENVLGAPPPPPPPNVPDLKDRNSEGRVLSMRERMGQHRSNPSCASCHAVMDPLGLAMEPFDAVGRWRERGESGDPIDAAGALPDGTAFDGPAGLKRALLAQPDTFVATVIEKLLTYALGRGLEPTDAPAIRAIKRDAARSGYGFASIVGGIVSSVPFQMRSSSDAVAQVVTASGAARP